MEHLSKYNGGKTMEDIELQQEFVGIREAARELGLNSPNIIRSLKSNGKYSGGSLPNIGKTHWIYKEIKENENN